MSDLTSRTLKIQIDISDGESPISIAEGLIKYLEKKEDPIEVAECIASILLSYSGYRRAVE